MSIIIPTRNSSKTLRACLQSVRQQDYTHGNIEILVVDGRSTDETRQIAEEFNARVLDNPSLGFYTGKAIGVEAAKNGLLLFIDSDNVLVGRNWLQEMVRPFLDDSDVVASEALYYGYSKSLGLINRFCALVGSDDVFSVYLGFYGRFSYLKGRWTDVPLSSQDRGSYIVVHLSRGRLPTMGANGFLIRADVLKRLSYKPYFFDVDLAHEMVELGYRKVARVKVAVIHLFAESCTQFIRKTYRRIRDYYIFSRRGLRKYNWASFEWPKFLKLILGILVPPLLIKDSIMAYRKKPDTAWFLLWPLCFLTALVYLVQEVSSGFYLFRQKLRKTSEPF